MGAYPSCTADREPRPGVTFARIREVLLGYVPRTVEDASLRLAAVLIPLYEEDGRIWVLLTRRTDRVAVHKGQISFPGGAVEEKDPDALHAALREAEEELGIRREDVEVLGQVDDECTVVSGFLIRPFVGRLPHPYPLRPAEEEIAEVIRIPLAFFLDPRAVEVRRDPSGRLQYFYRYQGHVVWGATARILRRFTSLLEGDG
ncbi:MAG: CoA pyrophosphatase [Armatimonadota bacterium]|nr:CoA pyrophosphatase [Armatimonadota bacterium]MDR7443617.1 CoA pyrophosphatase [Armatimonadota bacterium]MDR7570192.1 CoA pyrophosphatase [Armatimonadota bacterium]MDR7613853.1 CoA pyrophosphatase [Armatimonadota bacterium]